MARSRTEDAAGSHELRLGGGTTTSQASMAGPAGPAGWQAVTQALAKALSPAGLDLVHPGPVRRGRQQVSERLA